MGCRKRLHAFPTEDHDLDVGVETFGFELKSSIERIGMIAKSPGVFNEFSLASVIDEQEVSHDVNSRQYGSILRHRPSDLE